MTKAIDPKQVAASNPAVENEKVEAARAAYDDMVQAGLLRPSGYGLSPPLWNDRASTTWKKGSFVLMSDKK